MGKELEALEPSVLLEFIDGLLKRYENKTDYNIYITKDWLLEIKKAIKRLESIDNSNPSEALECWKWINATIPQWVREKDKEHPNVLEPIKQALLKAQEQEQYYFDLIQLLKENNMDYYMLKEMFKQQEPKQYLKWEDLEFSFKDKYMKVKLNGNIYTLRYTRNALMEFPVAYLEFDNTEITIIDCKKQFFNDLHLERVEE